MRLSALLAAVLLASWAPGASAPDPHRHARSDSAQHAAEEEAEEAEGGEGGAGRTWRIGSGPMQCGEYSSELTAGGQCRLTATLPQLEGEEPGQRCPDMFRCTDEVSYWLQENQERRRQLEELRESVSELQEELRHHRHRLHALEEQAEERAQRSGSVEQGLRALEEQQAELAALLRVHGTLLLDLQTRVRNLTSSTQAQRPHACPAHLDRTAPLLSAQDAPHQEEQHVGNCPVDCASLYHNGVNRSGVYTLLPSGGHAPVQVFCDMETAGGGWTVFQRRQDGSVSFDRGWLDYRQGFGELRAEHWLGNELLHLLTTQGDYSLRISLEDWTHKHKHALYQSFRIEDEENRYRLHVSGFSGTVPDSFAWYHDKRSFSTPDSAHLCAQIAHAGWWFHQCFYANLNGVYYKGGRYSPQSRTVLGPDGVVWYSWKNSDYYSLKKVTMMIRPRAFRPRLSP